MSWRLLIAMLLIAGPASAQRTRVAVGIGSAGLGTFGAAFDQQVEGFAQVAPGLAAQRSFPVWWTVEAEGAVPKGPVEVGARIEARWSQADALYGDYAGTVDVTGRVRAVLVEAVVAVPLTEALRVQAHGGGIALESRLTSDAAAALDGQSALVQYSLRGTGLGITAGASLMLDVPVGRTAVSARLGARWGHVRELDATERTPTSQTTGRLRLDHALSGATLTIGIGL